MSDRARSISEADRVRSLTFQCDLQRDRIAALEHEVETLRLRLKQRRGVAKRLRLRLGSRFIVLEMLLRRQSVRAEDLAGAVCPDEPARARIPQVISELRRTLKPFGAAILGLRSGDAYRIIPRHKSLIREALEAGRPRRWAR